MLWWSRCWQGEGGASAGGYPCPLPFDSMGTVGLRSDDLEGGLDEEYGIVFEEAEDFKQAHASAATAKLGLKAPTDFQRRENRCDQIFRREQARAVVLVGSLDTAGGVHRVADYSEVDFVGMPELADEDGAVVEPDAGLE